MTTSPSSRVQARSWAMTKAIFVRFDMTAVQEKGCTPGREISEHRCGWT